VSGAIASRLTESGVRDKLIHTIPNAIDQRRKLESRFDARRRLGLADEEFVIGWVGRMSHEKGLDVLIDALATIGKPFKAIFVGDGPDRTLLQGRARAVGADSSIVWAGVLPDAASIFAAFDTFVLSSRTEGIPIVLLEAMRASVPIVSTRVGGVPEMLGENEAFLVETSRPDLVAAAIDTVAREPANALSRATMARARLERDFTVEPWVDRYDAVYRAVLGRSGVGER
jgi:glycosyltransferase involved in cell wall biosynthesis